MYVHDEALRVDHKLGIFLIQYLSSLALTVAVCDTRLYNKPSYGVRILHVKARSAIDSEFTSSSFYLYSVYIIPTHFFGSKVFNDKTIDWFNHATAGASICNSSRTKLAILAKY